MFSPKLIELLQHLSIYKRNRLRKFLQSPYFNEQLDVLVLFDLTDKALRKGEEAVFSLEKPKMWKKIYPSKTFDDLQFRRLTSELINLSLQFLGQEYIAQRPLNTQVAIHMALTPTDLEKHIATVERRIESALKKKGQKSLDDYYFNYKYSIGRLGIATKNSVPKNYLEYLMPLDQQLDVFYVAQKLQLFCRLVIFTQTRQSDSELEGIDQIVKLAHNPKISNVPLIESYRKALQCLRNIDDEGSYRSFLDALHRNEHAITKEDLQDLYQHALNFCAFRINKGHSNFLQEMFDNYKIMVKNDLLVLHGYVPENQYKNIIAIALNCGAFEWVESFIKSHSDYLPEHLRENAISYNLAYINFIKKNYDEVVEILRNVEYSNLSYALGARWLLLRTYFETDEYQALDSLLESFRVFVMRNRLMSSRVKKLYLSMIALTRRISSYPTPEKLAVIKKKVNTLDTQMGKGWLLKKIEEMEKRK